jgi:hypothetical protein
MVLKIPKRAQFHSSAKTGDRSANPELVPYVVQHAERLQNSVDSYVLNEIPVHAVQKGLSASVPTREFEDFISRPTAGAASKGVRVKTIYCSTL